MQLKIHTSVVLDCVLAIICFIGNAPYKLQFVWETDNTFDSPLENINLYSRNFSNFNYVILGKGTRFDPNDNNNMCYTIQLNKNIQHCPVVKGSRAPYLWMFTALISEYKFKC